MIKSNRGQREQTITTENLSIGYKKKKNVKKIAQCLNTELYSGELTCLIGQNGVGKSTLLKTLSAFIPSLEGKIIINGKNIAHYSEKELSTKIGVVLTEKCLVKNMTVLELVLMGRSPYTGFWGEISSQDKEIAIKSIEVVGIEKLSDRLVETLSDGERQKAMIAKVLTQQTPIIFLDEPTAFLDFPSKVEIMKLLNKISREQSKTIFMSTHDLELALQIADRLWLMDKNNSIQSGTPEDLSLSGVLSTFFADKGIAFDMESGLFRVTNSFYDYIRLVGHGQKYSMIKKALQRNGVKASRSIECENYIEVGELKNGIITIHLKGKEAVYVTSIEHMLEVVVGY